MLIPERKAEITPLCIGLVYLKLLQWVSFYGKLFVMKDIVYLCTFFSKKEGHNVTGSEFFRDDK